MCFVERHLSKEETVIQSAIIPWNIPKEYKRKFMSPVSNNTVGNVLNSIRPWKLKVFSFFIVPIASFKFSVNISGPSILIMLIGNYFCVQIGNQTIQNFLRLCLRMMKCYIQLYIHVHLKVDMNTALFYDHHQGREKSVGKKNSETSQAESKE